MKKETKELKKLKLIFTFLLVNILLVSFVYSAKPIFVEPPIERELFTVAQDFNFLLSINVTEADGDLPITFTDDAGDTGFVCFNKNKVSNYSMLINFTPEDKCVGFYSIIISATDSQREYNTLQLFFNITNINDPPIIINTSPNKNYTVEEDGCLNLSVEIFDKDFEGDNNENLTFTWFVDGELSYKINHSKSNQNTSIGVYKPNVSDFDSGLHIIKVIVNDSFNITDSYNWTINVTNVNQKPIFSGIISNLTINESSNKTKFLSLSDYFSDPDANGTFIEVDTGNYLNFSYLVTSGDDSNVSIIINQTNSNVSIFLDEYWFGNLTIRYYIDDNNLINNRAYSNDVLIKVLNLNDAPALDFVPNQTAYGYAQFNYNVSASDKDFDVLNFHINSSTLDNISINLKTGLISLFANNSYIGNHTINVTVSDGFLNDSQVFNLEFKHNLPPNIYNYTNITVPQHNLSWFIIRVSDPDGDNYSLNSTSDLINSITKINDSAWNFTTQPISQYYVGNSYEVLVFANDIYNATSSTSFYINVTETYVKPIIFPTSVPNNKIVINKEFIWYINAYDEDSDILNFSTNTSLFNLSITNYGSINSNTTAKINFTPTQIGSHNINITVNDSKGYKDSFIFNLDIVSNSAPFFSNIANLTCDERSLCEYQVKADDNDWQDKENLVFSDNTDLFNISSNGLISFTSNFPGNYDIIISVSDGTAITNHQIKVNISDINNPPYFTQDLSSLSVWNNITEGFLTTFNITAIDDENQSITSFIEFINFTNLNGTTFTSGIDLFNLSNKTVWPDNSTTYFINFTPLPEQVGKYYIRFTASDNHSNTSQEFSFDVLNINNLPEVTWTLNYPNQSLLVTNNSYFYHFNAIENTSLSINSAVFDPDYDSLIYTWVIKYPNKNNLTLSNNSNLNFTFPFHSSDRTLLYLIVNDSSNSSTTVVWDIAVLNVNRPVKFGEYVFDIKPNVGFFQNTTIVNNSIIPIYNSSTNLYPIYSSYISPEIDFLTTSSDIPRIEYLNLSYNDKINDSSYNISIGTFTSDIRSVQNYSFINLNNNNISSEDYKYFRFKINHNLTNQSIAPQIDTLKINYQIPDFNVTAGTEYVGWLNLDNFFKDPDDDKLAYNFTTISRALFMNVSIVQDKFVNLKFYQKGNVLLQFNATDPYNSSVLSNVINITITTPSEQIEGDTSSGGGSSGGSSGSTIITEPFTMTQYDEQPVSMDLIHPEKVTIFENETISIPVQIKNNDVFDLEGVNISIETSNRDDVSISVDKDFFDLIPSETTETILITISPKTIFDNLDIFVKVNVLNPEYEDSTKIMLTNFKRLKESNESEMLKFAFVNDLLTKNSECAELNEYLIRAKDYFDQGLVQEGNDLLEEFITDCKYLISKKVNIEQPSNNLTRVQRIAKSLLNKDDHLLLIISIIVIVIISILLSILIYRKV